MVPRKNLYPYAAFLLLYAALFAYNLSDGSKGAWDNVASLFIVTAIFLLSGWADLGPGLFLLANLPLLAHNLGTVGTAVLYGTHLGPLPYDKFIHLFSTIVFAALLFRTLLRHRMLRSVAAAAFFAFTVVSFFGVMTEIVEYEGYLHLPSSSGFFNSQQGPAPETGTLLYADTVTDLIANEAGALAGVLLFLPALGRSTRGRAKPS